jgi:hypothetical protein
MNEPKKSGSFLGMLLLAVILYGILALWAGPLLALPCLLIAFLHASDKSCRC